MSVNSYKILKKKASMRLNALNYNIAYNAKTKNGIKIDIFAVRDNGKNYEKIGLIILTNPTEYKLQTKTNLLNKYVDKIIFITFDNFKISKKYKSWKFDNTDVIKEGYRLYEWKCNKCSKVFYTQKNDIKCCPYCKYEDLTLKFKENIIKNIKLDVGSFNVKLKNVIVLKNPQLFKHGRKIFKKI